MDQSTDQGQTEPLLILPESPEFRFPTQDQEDLAVISFSQVTIRREELR